MRFVVAGVVDREQHPAIRFIGEQSQKLSLLVVLLREGQSAVSDGARVGHLTQLHKRNIGIKRESRNRSGLFAPLSDIPLGSRFET